MVTGNENAKYTKQELKWRNTKLYFWKVWNSGHGEEDKLPCKKERNLKSELEHLLCYEVQKT
jgi:hypothetical protein